MIKIRHKCQTFLMLSCLLVTGFISSCGYLSDESVKGQDVFISDNLNGSCELDTDALGKIFEENVEDQIHCLEENFAKFIRYVKRENRDYVNEDELGTFVRRFFQENSESIINGMKILFQLNMIMLDDEKGRISTDNVGPLFKLLKSSNREVVKITKILGDMNKTNYWVKREEFREAMSRFSDTTLSIINESQDDPKKLNLPDFFREIDERFDGFEISDDLIDSIVFMKHLFLGGKAETITTWEIKKLIHKAPKLVILGLDFYYVSEKHFPKNQNWEIFEFYKQKLAELEDILHPNYSEEKLFSNQDLMKIVRSFTQEGADLEKYEKLIYSFKHNLIRGDDEYYSFGDMKLGLNYGKVLMEGISSFQEFASLTKDIDQRRGKVERDLIAQDLYSRATKRSKEIREILDPNVFPEQINLNQFLKDSTILFENETLFPEKSIEVSPEIIETAFALKVAFLGGNREVTKYGELEDLFKLYPSLMKDAFKLIYYNGEDFKKEDDLLRHYFEIVDRIKDDYLSQKGDSHGVVFKTQDLVNIAEEFLTDYELDFVKFVPTLEYLKRKWIGGPADQYRHTDIKRMLGLGNELLKRTYFFAVTYEGHEELMNSTKEIESVPDLDLEEYQDLTSSEIQNFRKDFAYTAKNFRHFRSDEGANFYDHEIRRFKTGFVETSMIHWATKHLINVFDWNDSNGLDNDEVDFTLRKFKPVLQEFNLWGTDMRNFAQNALLLSDLFQSTSNGSLEVNRDEFTEFASLVLMSQKVSGEVITELKKIADGQSDLVPNPTVKCYYKNPDDPVIPAECYRKYFFPILFEKLKLREELPQLYSYTQNSNQSQLNKYLRNIEGFARDPGTRPNDPIGLRELSKVFGAMLNIEATFIRFDKSQNNIVSTEDAAEVIYGPNPSYGGPGPGRGSYRGYGKNERVEVGPEYERKGGRSNRRVVREISELDKAFEVYRDAIIAVAGLNNWAGKAMSKSIFLYMLDHQAIPSTGQALGYYVKPFKKVNANRSSIGSLLYFMVQQNGKDEEEKQLKDIDVNAVDQVPEVLEDVHLDAL